MSVHLQAALAELTAKRDALNGVIAALQGVISVEARPLATLPPPVGARPPRPRRVPAPPKRAAVNRPAPPTRVAKLVSAPARAELTEARGEAILAALKRNDGIGTSKYLQAAMPKEPGLNAEQKDDAYRNTMTRLKNKGLIGRTGDTWSIVGIGSERT